MANFEYEEQETGFFKKYGLAIGLTVMGAGGVFFISKLVSGHGQGLPPKPVEMVMIKPMAPSPPPPPPPPPQVQQEQKMMEQAPVDQDEVKPEEQPQAAPALGTGIAGNGPPDGFGLSDKGGNGFINGGKSGHGGGSRFGWYAALVTKTFRELLGQNPKIRLASFNTEIRIWADPTGHITRIKLGRSTKSPEVDDAIKTTFSNGYLPEPPPTGMPMPIVMRLSARRPN